MGYDFSSWEQTLPDFLQILGEQTPQEYMRVLKLNPTQIPTPEPLLAALRGLAMTNRVNDNLAGLQAMRVLSGSAIVMTQRMAPEVADPLQEHVGLSDYLGLYGKIALLLEYTLEPARTALHYTGTLISATHQVIPSDSGLMYTSPTPIALQIAHWTIIYWGYCKRCGAAAALDTLEGVLRQLSHIQPA